MSTFYQDYEIRIKADMNGEPYFSLLKKGEYRFATKEDLKVVKCLLDKLVKKLDKSIGGCENENI